MPVRASPETYSIFAEPQEIADARALQAQRFGHAAPPASRAPTPLAPPQRQPGSAAAHHHLHAHPVHAILAGVAALPVGGAPAGFVAPAAPRAPPPPAVQLGQASPGPRQQQHVHAARAPSGAPRTPPGPLRAPPGPAKQPPLLHFGCAPPGPLKQPPVQFGPAPLRPQPPAGHAVRTMRPGAALSAAQLPPAVPPVSYPGGSGQHAAPDSSGRPQGPFGAAQVDAAVKVEQVARAYKIQQVPLPATAPGQEQGTGGAAAGQPAPGAGSSSA